MAARQRTGRARVATLVASGLVLLSVPFDLIPWLRGPAPYPPEWQWAFRPEGPARPLLGAAACAFGLLGLLAASGTPWARRHPSTARRALIVGAVLLGCGLQVSLLAREPGPPLRTLLSRARSPSFTSYHAVAISPAARDPGTFLRGHAESLPELARTAKHAATHPPGPVLYYRAALAACEAAPGLTEGLLAAAGVSDRPFRAPATRAARAAALLGALLLGLLGALAAWPLARLAMGLGMESLAAGRLAVLWTLLPGPALMTPQFDQALALPVAGAAALLLAAGVGAGTGLGRAVAAGLLGSAALLASYGASAFLTIGGLAALLASGVGWRRGASLAALAGATSGVVAFGLPALLGHEPVRALTTALSIHREAYTTPRSYGLWLVFNPLDLALFVGVPVAAGCVLALVAWVRRARSGEPPDSLARFREAVFGGLAVLLILGVTRGEVGRLWIPLMPLLLITGLGGAGDTPNRRSSLFDGALLAALTLTLGSYWIT